ncbi:MAG: 50S ribosomal protein L9 [Bacilli bacterium]
MKIILLEDIKGKGKKDQIIDVASGYAMHLIKEKKALEASSGNVKVIAKKQDDALKKLEEDIEAAKANQKLLEAKTIEFKLNVGKDGRVFKSVSSKQIVDHVLNKYQIKLDKRKFLDNVKINNLGVTKVKVELAKGVVATLNIHVKEL